MSDDPRHFNRPDRPTLTDADTAGLGQAVLTLTHELWVLIDRVTVLEAVIEDAGIDVREKIENFTPDEALKKELDARGRALVARVAEAMAGLPATDDNKE